MTLPGGCVELTEEFLAYCKLHPYLRFWQALLAWSGLNKLVEVVKGKAGQFTDVKDTFYWKGRNG